MWRVVLPEGEWLERQARHVQRVETLLAGHRERAGRGRSHPVEDFLFSYYSWRPAQLLRWHPGAGTGLAGPAAAQRRTWREQTEIDGAVGLDVPAFLARRGEAARFIAGLLSATAARPAHLGCFGLHEWAMVYRQDAEQLRHARWPLRLGSEGTDAVVESHRIRCTHHDAFRFFTGPARPLNAVQPSRVDQVALEQPGCLHVTMDLYKWAYKLSPALASELVVDCFELARRTRELDMRASPYDLAELGHAPIPIETPQGKADYVAAQRELAEAGQLLRERLLGCCRLLLRAGHQPVTVEGD